MNLELVQAARLIGFDPMSGWPQTFKPFEIAILQGKDDTEARDILEVLLSDIKMRIKRFAA